MSNGQVRNYTVADGLSSNLVLKLYDDQGGGISVGTMKGLDRLEGDRFLKVSSVPSAPSYPMGEDHSGALYVSLNNGGMFRVDSGGLIQVTPSANESYMIETEQGDLWINGGSIFRVSRAALEEPRGHDEPLDLARFGTTDGLISQEGSIGYPSSALTRDGKLWMATVQGLALRHFGLQGMRERAARIGSKLTLISSPKSGTEMTLVVPGGIIFRKANATRWGRIKTLLRRKDAPSGPDSSTRQ